MNFFSTDNKHLSIAWNYATVGSNARRLRKHVKRNTIMTFNIPKICQVLQDQHMLLGTKARLLFGVSKIMEQQTFFLYEDSMQLCNKLKFGLADPHKLTFVDMEKPLISASAITLRERDPLLEFSTSRDAPIFSDLFNINSCTFHKVDEMANSLLIYDHSLDLIEPGFTASAPLPPHFTPDQVDFMDIDDPIEPDDLVDPNTMFDFPNTAILTSKDLKRSPGMSPQHTPSSHGLSYHANLSRPPSLILEEEEEEEGASFYSADTAMFDTMIRVSPVPPVPHRPRQVQRMMMRHADDITLTVEDYQTDHIVVNRNNKVQKRKRHTIKDQLLRPMHVVPQDLIEFFKIHQHFDFMERVRGIERPRRYEHRRNTSGSSSSCHTFLNGGGGSAGVSMRSTSDIQTPEMQNMELGQDNDTDDPIQDKFFDFPSDTGGHPIEDNFDFITFDNEANANEIEEEGKEKILEQIEWILDNSETEIVPFQELVQFKTRSQVSKTFYYILELATDGKICTSQFASFEQISILLNLKKA